MIPVDALSPEDKRARLAQLLRERAAAAAPREYPLSYNQAALLHLHSRAPESSAYNTMWSATLRGTLDRRALNQAFAGVVERHSILRTTFHWRAGQPYQSIQTGGARDIQFVDASALTSDELERRILDEAAKPFDLDHGPVVRMVVFNCGPREHLLLCAAHHIAVDYWSLVLLMGELEQLYADRAAGRQSSLPPVGRQYVDHVRWQLDYLQSREGVRLGERWQSMLAGELPLLNLPTDGPRPPVQSFRGDSCRFAIDGDLLGELRTLARTQGTTLYTLCLAVFQVLLHRYTGQTDIIVGSPMAGRTSVGSEDVIGYFANTIALRVGCAGNPRFTEFLEHVATTVLHGIEGQDYPFPLLVERLKVARDPSRAPLCDVLFSWDKTHHRDAAPAPQAADPSHLVFEPREIGQLGSTHDVTLVAFERSDELEIAVQYSVDLFTADTIRRLSGHFTNLLRGVVANPAERIGRLSLIGDEERRRVLVEWNATAAEYPRDRTVHALFESQVEARPDAVALMCGASEISYGGLNRRANQVAHFLSRHGVGAGQMVGVCTSRSIETLAIILGILKAGGAYVPLDPSYPSERLAFMIGELGLSLVLAERAYAGRVAEPGCPVIRVDDDDPFAAEATADPSPSGTADSLAYVMFTSGSTGQPKGVGVPHRAIVRLVKNTNFLPFSTTDVFLHAAPMSFDASTLEVWGGLLNGGRVGVLAAETPSLDQLSTALRQYGVTTLWLTAGLFHLMIDQRPEDLGGLRYLLAGGDVLSVPHVAKALRLLTGCRLINGYGPTENTTFTCCHQIAAAPPAGMSVPIGRPVANTQIYILDEHLRPVPIGIAGELYAGGDGLALGYVNRPELTAERFVADPFSDQPGARLYKTGDLARWLGDGTVEFLGRRDQQVKVRGFRIELSEIEDALRRHANVRDCAVTIAAGSGGDKRLVAYAMPREAPAADSGELRRHLQGLLPDYMVPAFFITVDSLPLSPNGKVDRRRLPPPDAAVAATGPAYLPPAAGTEALIARIWSAALKLDRIGRHDNFFDLGGHSLLVMQVHAELAAALTRDLPIVDLFRFPTVSTLAAHLSGQDGDDRAFIDIRGRAQQQRAAQSRRLSSAMRKRGLH